MMSRLRRFATTVLLSAAILGFGAPSHAATIRFQATDLADLVAGQDLWRYTYTVSGSFVQFGGFNILFNPNLYRNLQDPPPAVNAQWSPSVIEPAPGLPADGIYTATALVSNPSVADLFSLTFIWLGGAGTTPGPQPFEIFDATFFPPLETGVTAPLQQSVPLPGTLVLFSVGMLVLCVRGTLKPIRTP